MQREGGGTVERLCYSQGCLLVEAGKSWGNKAGCGKMEAEKGNHKKLQ